MSSITRNKKLVAFFCGALSLLFGNAAWAEYGLNMRRGVTEISREVYDLHMLIFWICTLIGVLVFSVMIYSIFMHRKSRGATAAQFHESTLVEIIWTAIPFLILVGMAIPSTIALINLEDASEPEMTVQVTGYQWKWKYDYLDDGVSFFSNLAPSHRDAINGNPTSVENYLLEVDQRLVLPTNTRIRFLVTAEDVIHSWWVPDLGWKQDAIPGFINDAWTNIETPGVYRGQCAELCGKDHGFMPVVVEALAPEDYRQWVDEQKAAQKTVAESADREWTLEQLMERGKEVYGVYCVACHQANGQGLPPAFPAIAGSPVATGALEEHQDRVINGQPGTAMAAFGKQLSAVDLAAVITFERNAFGNNMGDMVQPTDIQNVLETN